MIENISLPTLSGLMVNQAVKITTIYQESGDWQKCRQEVLERNIMQIDKESSSRRYVAYVIKMLKMLSDEELRLLIGSSLEDQKAIMWLAFCRSYPLVGLFAAEVVREKFLSRDYSLSISDWNEFLARKAQENDSIDNIGKETRRHARSVVMGNLRQAGLLSSSNELKAAEISEDVKKTIGKDLVFYPILSSGGAL